MPDQEEITATSAAKLRDMTRARDDIPDNRHPLCYEQCVELDGKVEQVLNVSGANE